MRHFGRYFLAQQLICFVHVELVIGLKVIFDENQPQSVQRKGESV